MSDLVKQAERNLINTAKTFEDVLQLMDALNHFGNAACHQYVGQEQFFEGLNKMRMALLNEYSHAMSQCFIFVGVGGEEAQEYSREKFMDYFGEDGITVMHFLERFGHMPNSWNINDEKEFKKQARSKID